MTSPRQPSNRASLYTVLGCDIRASQDTVRRRYLKLARRWHPDRHGGSDEAKRNFQEIVAAFEILSSVEKRAQYDLGLLDQLDVEDYLQRYQGLILTVCGLGMGSSGMMGDVEEERMRRVRSDGWLLTA
ncbi:hypothetical protein FOA52_004098 [Chlamydomonas sp. UWO 241]|nr:hypothetical protein FOA52_004098 [Chlamydomonas sp. UWO 241]